MLVFPRGLLNQSTCSYQLLFVVFLHIALLTDQLTLKLFEILVDKKDTLAQPFMNYVGTLDATIVNDRSPNSSP